MSSPAAASDPDWGLESLNDQPLLPPLHCFTACCCSAPARVRVLLPSPDDPATLTDLLLCGHHFRQHSQELSRRGAIFVHEALPAEDGSVAADQALVPSPR